MKRRAVMLLLLVLAGHGWAQTAAPPAVVQTNALADPPEQVAKREYDLGMTFVANGQLAGAIEAFQRATLLQPELAEAHGQLGMASLAMGKLSLTAQQQLDSYRLAAERLAKASALRPKDTTYLLRWAEALVLIGDLPVDARVRLGCYQGAAEKYRRVTELLPQEAEAYMHWGALTTTKLPQFAADDKGRALLHQNAVELVGKAVERCKYSSELAPAYVLLGTALARQARYTTEMEAKKKLFRLSVEKFERAVRAQPNTASTYALWGAATLELGKLTRLRTDYRDACAHLSTSLALSPNDTGTMYTLACAYALMDNSAMAIANLKKCFELDLSGNYRTTAVREPDLASLRGHPEFEELFTKKASSNVAPFNPRLSDGPR